LNIGAQGLWWIFHHLLQAASSWAIWSSYISKNSHNVCVYAPVGRSPEGAEAGSCRRRWQFGRGGFGSPIFIKLAKPTEPHIPCYVMLSNFCNQSADSLSHLRVWRTSFLVPPEINSSIFLAHSLMVICPFLYCIANSFAWTINPRSVNWRAMCWSILPSSFLANAKVWKFHIKFHSWQEVPNNFQICLNLEESWHSRAIQSQIIICSSDWYLQKEPDVCLTLFCLFCVLSIIASYSAQIGGNCPHICRSG